MMKFRPQDLSLRLNNLKPSSTPLDQALDLIGAAPLIPGGGAVD